MLLLLFVLFALTSTTKSNDGPTDIFTIFIFIQVQQEQHVIINRRIIIIMMIKMSHCNLDAFHQLAYKPFVVCFSHDSLCMRTNLPHVVWTKWSVSLKQRHIPNERCYGHSAPHSHSRLKILFARQYERCGNGADPFKRQQPKPKNKIESSSSNDAHFRLHNLAALLLMLLLVAFFVALSFCFFIFSMQFVFFRCFALTLLLLFVDFLFSSPSPLPTLR